LVGGGYLDRVGELQARLDQLMKGLNKGEAGLVGRAARVAALLLLGAELAEEFGVLSVGNAKSVADAVDVIWGDFAESEAANPQETMVGEMRQWIASRLNMSIFSVDDTARHSVEADGWFEGDTVYLLATRITKPSKGAAQRKAVVKALEEAGVLQREKRDRTTSSYIPKRGAVLHYRINAAKLGLVLDPDFEEAAPEK
jgi:hypothetical protein